MVWLWRDGLSAANAALRQYVSHHVPRSALNAVFAASLAWPILIGLVTIEVWPAVPTTAMGWVLFVLVGPPAYVLLGARLTGCGQARLIER